MLRTIPIFALLLVVLGCKEGTVEVPSFRVVKNISNHEVTLSFFNEGGIRREVLSQGDSLVFEGVCFEGLGQGYFFDWDGEYYDSASVVFAEKRIQTYAPTACNGDKNLLADEDFRMLYCGYRQYYLDENRSFIFEITNEDYESAEPL